MGKKLIRTMRGLQVEGFTRPKLGINVSRALAIRHCVYGTNDGNTYDIFTDADGMITDFSQGLSVVPPPKENMPRWLLNTRQGEHYFFIDEDFLDSNEHLVYIEDEPDAHGKVIHGVIAPRYTMHIDDYISYLDSTQGFWEVLHDELESERTTKKSVEQQLDAESQRLHYKPNR